jgi:uncharacterized protein YkwD
MKKVIALVLALGAFAVAIYFIIKHQPRIPVTPKQEPATQTVPIPVQEPAKPEEPKKEEPKKEAPKPSTPAEQTVTVSPLQSAILSRLNQERRARNLSEFKFSQKLNVAAQAKTDDEIARQYFSHFDPSERCKDQTTDDCKVYVTLANKSGYRYLQIGEILAEGWINNNKTLNIGNMVNAWMNSPTHRNTILIDAFSEAGIGITHGKFNGKDTIMVAVIMANPKK